MQPGSDPRPDQFSPEFQDRLHDLMRWRRDVRHFHRDPVDEALVRQCLDAFRLAPSVGLSEPWRVIRLSSDSARHAALTNFEDMNAAALKGYGDEKAALYARLKLSGMHDAPVQFAIYCDETTSKGAGLGAGSMPEMRRYSVVGAVTCMWLAARALGLGMGWVSVLDPDRLNRDLDVPADWALVAYLCLGWPRENTLTPELEREGWEIRSPDLYQETR